MYIYAYMYIACGGPALPPPPPPACYRFTLKA